MEKARPAVPCEGEITDTITVDLDAIPGFIWDSLAAATMDLVRDILRQPGGRELLDAKTAARKAAKERS